MSDIICAGFGGQGVLTAGLILASTGLDADKNVTWIPSYGSEMRGGTANCHVKIDDDEIPSPYIKNPDIVIAMNEPSINKFEESIKPGGILIVNSSMVDEREYRSDITVLKVPANELVKKVGEPRAVNVLMLGSLAKASGIFTKDFFESGIEKFFAEKGKNNPLNIKAFHEGYVY